MKRPLPELLLVVRLLWAISRENFEAALKLVERLERRRPLELHHQAFKGMLLFRTDHPKESRALLVRVRDALKQRDDANSRYVRRYVQAWLATLNFDPFQARYEEREAAKIDCRPSLKRFLWMPDGQRQDPLDAEFDAWLKANYPEE